MSRRFMRVFALFAVLSLILAACGNGADPTTTTAAAPAETTAPDDTPDDTPDEAPDDTTAPDEPMTEGPLGAVVVGPGEPIKIATLQAISGDVASLGEDQNRATEIAIADKGDIQGFEIELSYREDDLCNSEGGQTGSTRIVADPDVIGVIGTSCSGAGVPASRVVTGAGRVLISGSNTSPVLTSFFDGNPGPEYHEGYYRTAHNDAIQGAAAARFVFEELGLSSVATINDGDPYTQGLTTAFGASFEELGGSVVLATAVTPEQTDMRPVLTEVAAAGAELIFFPIFQPAGDFIPEQAPDISGLEDVVLMGADGLLSDTYVVLPQTKGMYFSGPSTPETPEYADFVAKYVDAYGEEPIQSFHAHAYDATNMLLAAIEEVAVMDGDNLVIDLQGVRDALNAINWSGLTGSLVCDDFGDCADPTIFIVQNTDDTPTIADVRANVQVSYTAAELGF